MTPDLCTAVWLLTANAGRALHRRFAGDDRGEGVISTAIAVLIVAFLGVAAYALFSTIVDNAGRNACEQVGQIGGGGGGGDCAP